MLIFSITVLGPLTIDASLCFTPVLITVNYVNDRYLSTYYYYIMQGSWSVVTCRPTQRSKLCAGKRLCVAWQQSSPSPVAELFVLAEPNK